MVCDEGVRLPSAQIHHPRGTAVHYTLVSLMVRETHENRMGIHACPGKIFEKRRLTNPHAGYRRAAYQGDLNITGTWI